MIRITIELLPKGDESRKRHMGTAEISNDATGNQRFGNYRFRLSKMGKPSENWRRGILRGFDRVKLGPWDLLFAVLLQGLGERTIRICESIKANHGSEECPADAGKEEQGEFPL